MSTRTRGVASFVACFPGTVPPLGPEHNLYCRSATLRTLSVCLCCIAPDVMCRGRHAAVHVWAQLVGGPSHCVRGSVPRGGVHVTQTAVLVVLGDGIVPFVLRYV